MRNRAAIAFTTSLLAVCVLFLVVASRFEPGTRGVPVSIAALLCVMVAVQMVLDLRGSRATSLPDPVATERAGAKPDIAPGVANGPAAAPPMEAVALGWLLALAGSMALAGILGAAGWVSLYLRWRGREAWMFALSGGVITGVLVWLVMTHIVAAPIPFGLAGSLLAAFGGG